jgi:hypothetical protein
MSQTVKRNRGGCGARYRFFHWPDLMREIPGGTACLAQRDFVAQAADAEPTKELHAFVGQHYAARFA